MRWPISAINPKRSIDVVGGSSSDVLDGNNHQIEVILKPDIYFPGDDDWAPLSTNVFSRCVCSSPRAEGKEERSRRESNRPDSNERAPAPLKPRSLHKILAPLLPTTRPDVTEQWLPLSRLGLEPRRAIGTVT